MSGLARLLEVLSLASLERREDGGVDVGVFGDFITVLADENGKNVRSNILTFVGFRKASGRASLRRVAHALPCAFPHSG